MRHAVTIAAALLLAACSRGEANGEALPSPSPVTGGAEAVAECGLTVTFGSYAMGIDRGTLAKVEALLAGDSAVTRVDRHPWGREGELTLCIHTRSAREAKDLFYRVKPLFPAKPRGPLTVETSSGLKFTAQD